MLIAYWILGSALALVFAVSGVTKLSRSRSYLASRGMTYVEDFPGPRIKMIGALEVLGVFGLILPGVTGVLPLAGAVAALALCVLMIGATSVHIRRREAFVPPLALAVICFSTAAFGYLAFA